MAGFWREGSEKVRASIPFLRHVTETASLEPPPSSSSRSVSLLTVENRKQNPLHPSRPPKSFRKSA